jgi:hypothetical protein
MNKGIKERVAKKENRKFYFIDIKKNKKATA